MFKKFDRRFGKLQLVVDFAASWCGPCKVIEPAVKAIANKFPSVEFAKIDVDELPVITYCSTFLHRFFFFVKCDFV